jgi:hypothetical protein
LQENFNGIIFGIHFMEDLIVLTFFNAGVAQLVEHHVANVNVAGPSPVSRSKVIHIKVDFLFYGGVLAIAQHPNRRVAIGLFLLCIFKY